MPHSKLLCKLRYFFFYLRHIKHLNFSCGNFLGPLKLCGQCKDFIYFMRIMLCKVEGSITSHTVTENVDIFNIIFIKIFQYIFCKHPDTERFVWNNFAAMPCKVKRMDIKILL